MNLSICDGQQVIINYKLKEKDAHKIMNYFNNEDINLLNTEFPFDKDICSIQFLNNEEALKLKNEAITLYAYDIYCYYCVLNFIN